MPQQGEYMAHTPLTIAIWFGVQEAEDLYQFKLASMVGTAAMGSHPDMDASQVQALFTKQYEMALHGMPYSKAVEGPSAEVMQAVETYNRWKDFFKSNEGFGIKLE